MSRSKKDPGQFTRDIQKAVRAAIKDSGLTLHQVAARTEIPYPTLSRHLRAGNHLGTWVAFMVAGACGFRLSDLIKETEASRA